MDPWSVLNSGMIVESLTGKRTPHGPRSPLRELQEEIESKEYHHISVVPQGATIGAEIQGLDLCSPIDAATFEELEQAFIDYKVLFFRNQALDEDSHLGFARMFGPLEEHPFLPSGEDDQIVRFAKDEQAIGLENMWHSDVSWRKTPALGSVLRAREVPKVGGDTLFADMVAAYECLPDAVKRKLEGMTAVHDFSNSFGLMMSSEDLAKHQETYPPMEHPIIRTHPVSGRRLLYVNAIFTSHIVGMDREESDRTLDALFAQAAIPEFQCRFRWEPDSVAFWDNRSVQHYATNDYWPQVRVMERVSIVGDEPR